MICKKCGNAQDDDLTFCTECGRKLVGPSNCPDCGAELQPQVVFCGKCGKRVVFRVKSAVPYYERRTVKKISHLVTAWVFAGLFLLMLGLAFGNFINMKIVVPTGSYYSMSQEITLKASAADVLIASLSKKKTLNELSNELEKYAGSNLSIKDMERAINKVGILRITFCKEAVDAAPFSTRVTLIFYSLIVLAMIALSATFFGVSLSRAVKLTRTSEPGNYKPIRFGAFLASTAALALAAMLMIGSASFSIMDVLAVSGSVGYALKAMFGLSVIGLALLLAFNLSLTGKRYVSWKKFALSAASAGVAFFLLFSLGANAVRVKFEGQYDYYYSSESVSGSAGFGFLSDSAAIDNTINRDNTNYSAEQAISDIAYLLRYGLDGNIALAPLHPSAVAFYEDFGSGNRFMALALGIVSFVGYYSANVFAALMFAYNIKDIVGVDDLNDLSKKKARRRKSVAIVMLVFTALLLVSASATAITGSVLYKKISSNLIDNVRISAVIGFFAVFNFILALGALITRRVLLPHGNKIKLQAQSISAPAGASLGLPVDLCDTSIIPPDAPSFAAPIEENETNEDNSTNEGMDVN